VHVTALLRVRVVVAMLAPARALQAAGGNPAPLIRSQQLTGCPVVKEAFSQNATQSVGSSTSATTVPP
jgi:hypothetical protein